MISGFPTPSSSLKDTHGEGCSFIWKQPGRALRIRVSKENWELNEYEVVNGKSQSVRNVKGSEELCRTLAKVWFSGNQPTVAPAKK